MPLPTAFWVALVTGGPTRTWFPRRPPRPISPFLIPASSTTGGNLAGITANLDGRRFGSDSDAVANDQTAGPRSVHGR